MKIRAALAVAGLSMTTVLLAASPAQAQAPGDLTGAVTCPTPGEFHITWTLDNTSSLAGTVKSAELSGAAEGTVSFSPDPWPFGTDTITGVTVVSGDTVGTVNLEMTATFQSKGPFDWPFDASVELDGSCEAPSTTIAPTTTAAPTTSAVAAITAQPRFTG